MSYLTIATCVDDNDFTRRVQSAVAQEGGDAFQAFTFFWPVAAKSDIEAAFASALAAGNPAPGADEAVITDGMILSAVQAEWPPEPPA